MFHFAAILIKVLIKWSLLMCCRERAYHPYSGKSASSPLHTITLVKGMMQAQIHLMRGQHGQASCLWKWR